ncbi:expressed unknown protein [Seminavis robusta]|uniref:VWFD domain-containing protein n=1 Tax=Seminavis robusta TaxID=568900 RepID=A0A9N8HHX3_9STRA|nr:expressed unknown protein [Seminavis robusta]|eukprot:Sro469_g149320.1 n/a (484) ;mRNA; f:32172-33623
MKFLNLALLAVLPRSILALPATGPLSILNPAGVPIICETFSLDIEDVTFSFQNYNSDANLVNLGPGSIAWGDPAPASLNGNGQQSMLSTAKSVVTPYTAIVNDVFQLGSLTHHNNAILGIHVNTVELVVNVWIQGVAYPFVYDLIVHETPNLGGTACPFITGGAGCSDKVEIALASVTPQAVHLMNGVKFEIDLLGFRDCPTCALRDHFISEEGAASSSYLYAMLTLTDCPHRGGGGGDPHFETWTGHQFYDYMGACDLHLVQAPHFAPSLPLNIDVRTKIRNWYSYIESAVVQIGDETLEMGSFGEYLLNGVQGATMPNTIAGFEVKAFNPNKNFHILEVYIDEQEKIVLRSFKDMVSVKIDNAKKERFHDSKGMMGNFDTGHVLSRDGHTYLEDPNEIAKEWQVRDTEPMLFNVVSGPQHPQACVLPDRTEAQAERRLGGKTISQEAATKACAHWPKAHREGCVKDVIATGDLELAALGAL